METAGQYFDRLEDSYDELQGIKATIKADLRIIRENVKKLSRAIETEKKIAWEEAIINYIDDKIAQL